MMVKIHVTVLHPAHPEKILLVLKWTLLVLKKFLFRKPPPETILVSLRPMVGGWLARSP